MIAQVSRHQLHGQRIAPKRLRKFAGSRLFLVACEAVARLEVADEIHGVRVRQRLDLQGLLPALTDPETLRIQASGHQNLQPLLRWQASDLCGRQEL